MQRAVGLIVTAIALAVSASPADAGFNPRKLSRVMPAEASQMMEGEGLVAPIAYVRFCLNNSSQCQSDTTHERIELTGTNWLTLNEVNTAVNERIVADPNKGGFDWSIDATYGNCNDYAVQKRKALLDKGYPASALALSVVVTPWGEGHLVLTVRTDHGDYVLDNLRPTILSWDRTGYEFNRVQSFDDPQTWVHPERGTKHRGPRFFRIDASFDHPLDTPSGAAAVAAAACERDKA